MKNLLDKQTQTASNGSTSIQVGGDFTYAPQIVNEKALGNIQNILDNFNQNSDVWSRNKDFLSLLKSSRNLFFDISKNQLYLRNCLFSNEDVFFKDLYVPLKIKMARNFIRIKDNAIVETEVSSIDDDFLISNTRQKKIRNIVGWAGQGKSTVLCKIFTNQIEKGDLLPIFLSFRNINESIVIELRRLFQDQNIQCDEGNIIGLLRSQQVLLILDAFDEIANEDLKNNLLKEIKRIQKYGVEIICSSRPGTSLCNQPGIENYNLEDLEIEQAIEIIEKTNNSNTYKEKIKKLLDKNNNVKDSLKTPLLTVLFLKIYPTMDIIPEHAREFYDEIFNVLYIGHDKHKEGNHIFRELRDKYTRSETKFSFSLLCFISFLENKNSFTIDKAENFLNKGINTFRNKIPTKIQEIDRSSFIKELIECTSLLILDGMEANKDYYSYLHKTIQEYYAAFFFKEFIKNETSNEELMVFKEFITEKMFTDPTYISEFIKFLSVLDPNFVKINIIIPFFEKNFFDPTLSREENIENAIHVFEEQIVNFVKINIQSKLKKADHDHSTIANERRVSNATIVQFRIQEAGLIAFHYNSNIQDIISTIAYLFNLRDQVEDKFSKLMDNFMSFKTQLLFPLTERELKKINTGKTLDREFNTSIKDLRQKAAYQVNYVQILEDLHAVCSFIYDELYLKLKKEETQINNVNINSVRELFSN